MLKTFTQNVQKFFVGPYSLKMEDGFPYVQWTGQETVYSEFSRWYSGEALDEELVDSATNQKIEKFPIKINPLKGTARKHTAVLFGLNVDSMKSNNVPLSFIPSGDKTKRKRGKEVIVKIMKVLSDNHAATMFISSGIVSQYMGGCVFAARWRPDWNLGKGGIEISSPLPSEFIGIPDGTNYWSLKEAWIVRKITYIEARSYFPDLMDDATVYYYTEHWTRKEYRIAINGRVVEIDGVPLDGKNPFGIVPIVYIPHIREGKFLGESIITEFVKGVIREMNLRNADIGDAVSDDAHGVLAGRNISNGATLRSLADGRRYVDLGSSSGLGGESDQPDLFGVSSTSASDPMLKFTDKLEGYYRRETDHPAVADGEDQGSQRSSLTLNTRMWPLVSHVEMERTNWSSGMSTLAKIILTIMSIKKLDEITADDVELSFTTKWAPMLPRDREVLVNELSTRSSASIGSTKHLMSLTDDIEDPDEEWKTILKEKKELAEATAKEVQDNNPLENKEGAAPKNIDAKSGAQPMMSGQVAKKPKEE